MNAVIVSIGDEILIGQVTDTNAVWISQQLSDLGIKVREMLSISDTPEHINATLDRYVGSTDIICMTGGLGPTKDDLTKETLNDYFGGKLIIHKPSLELIEEFFRIRGREMIESNRKQAEVPDVCRVIKNERGSAPGMWFVKDGTNLFSMPGVPFEMKKMFSDQIIPEIKKELDVPAIIQRTIMTYDIPESFLAEQIKEWEENLSDSMKLAYLPRPGIVRLRLNVFDLQKEKADQLLNDKISALNEIIGGNIFAYEDVLFEKVLGEKLLLENLTICTAESCTGGNIAKLLTSIPGSSGYFRGSVIAYSNEIKEKILGVKNHSLIKFGAVSEAVVEEMAIGVRKLTGAGISIATSGIAGPGGGTKEKPVGTTWIAVSAEGITLSKHFRFSGHRELIIEQASMKALGMVYNVLKKRNNYILRK